MKRLTRREFLRIAGLMGGASLFAGCTLFGSDQPVAEYIKGAPAVDPLETLEGIKNVYSVCGLCAGNCGICCRVAQDTVVKIGGNPYNPVSVSVPLPWATPSLEAAAHGGSICAVGGSGIQTLYDPFRVAKPLKRVGPRGSGKWQAVSWEEAFKEITGGGNLFGEGKVEGLAALKESGQGLCFLTGRVDWGAQTFIRRFLAAFPGASLAIDQEVRTNLGAVQAADAVFGPGTGPVDADYRNAGFLLSWGDAPLDSGVPLVSIAREIADARVRDLSMRWVVVDPRLSTSASKSDLWLPTIPGTDLNLALATMKALAVHFPSALAVSRDSMARFTAGPSVTEHAKACGLSAEVPVKLAEWLANAGPKAAVIPGRGIFSQPDGLETAKAILALNVAVGSLPGSGGLVKRNDDFLRSAEAAVLGPNSRAVKTVDAGATVPALISWECNPVYDNPAAAFSYLTDRSKVPLFVAIDTGITETTVLADYILPDTTYLERWDICIPPPSVAAPGFGVRAPVVGGLDAKTGEYFPILPQTKPMEEILIQLAGGLKLRGFEPENPERLKNPRDFYVRAIGAAADAMMKARLLEMASVPDVQAILERGGLFGTRSTNKMSQPAQEPKKPQSLPTITARPTAGPHAAGLFLTVFTLPFHRSAGSGINSWLLEVLPENKLLINAADASKLHLKQQDTVVVESMDGKTKHNVKILIVPGIRPGVVALARGFGNRQDGSSPQIIDGNSIPPDWTRGTGLNTSSLVSSAKPSLVKVSKA